jgi:hypothetical protein
MCYTVIGSQLGGHQHRHPVTSAARQRDAHQQVIGRPVGLDVTEHVLLLERGPFERKAQRVTDDAVRTSAGRLTAMRPATWPLT